MSIAPEKQVVNKWWAELRHGGLLLSPSVLDEYLPKGPSKLDQRTIDGLRDSYTVFQAKEEYRKQEKKDLSSLHRWLDMVLEDLLKHQAPLWKKETDVPEKYKAETVTGERIRPNRVLLYMANIDKPRLLVKVDSNNERVGMGKGRTEHSKFITLLRATGVPLGIITNGYQFRLVYAGPDYDSWVEWEASKWFEEGGDKLLEGFVDMLGRYATEPRDDEDYPLIERVRDSRTRQGELSQVLGEQVRSAVELLTASTYKSMCDHPEVLDRFLIDPETSTCIPEEEKLEALYQSSIRAVMRLVICLFAESRDLLPGSLEGYNGSYGVEGLYHLLNEARQSEGDTSLREGNTAWPRITSLFQLICKGSPFEDMPVPGYGGELFKPGDFHSRNPVDRALAAYEDEGVAIDDYTVFMILKLLKIGRFRIRQGVNSTIVNGPVDFSDLSTEYIGMIYEGLLDYNLRQVREWDEAIVFLNIGTQPALPLSKLKAMTDAEIKGLIDTLSKEKAQGDEEEDEESGEQDQSAGDTTDIGEAPLEMADDATAAKCAEWARRAVSVAGWVKIKRSKSADPVAQERALYDAAGKLVWKMLSPGQMYLVRWSGTRKGSGTFYTKPQLAVPTVHRTLEEKAYTRREDGALIPKPPEEILSLKICDPAMGSGSFLVAALRYLTDAFYQSLLYYKRIRDTREASIVVLLPAGAESKGDIREELPDVPSWDERFELLLKARLKRHVVERCIYGVDINPLAVELAKLSLWVETMDKEIPFSFLDHKLKVGNSLLGAWLDTFNEYPTLAWMREGGDKGHTNGVHYKADAWTKEIKRTFNERVKPGLVTMIEARAGQKSLLHFDGDSAAVPRIQEHMRSVTEEIHGIPIKGRGIEKREECYHKLHNNEEYQRLKEAHDLWCSLWFWPADKIEYAPMPETLHTPAAETRRICKALADKHRFFHWELEFPDVFNAARHGFDAVIGNPPWEISKPNSREFFTVYDPIYRARGKQEAIKEQTALFERDTDIEYKWLSYNADFNSMSNYAKYAASPHGDPKAETDKVILKKGKANDTIHDLWRNQRKTHVGYTDGAHPYVYQGSAGLNTYKMFLEAGYALAKDGGHIGMIVPSGIYTDLGSTTLRDLFINHSKWEWLFGFENRKKIFSIDSRAKFCPIIICKGGRTEAIKAAFMRHDLSDWETPILYSMQYRREHVEKFSPVSKSLLEIRSEKDLKILEKIRNNGILIGDRSIDWDIKHAWEFNMTSDSRQFEKLPNDYCSNHELIANYRRDAYGRWLDQNGDMYLPLYEGRTIGQFDYSEKGWVTGKGRGAVWEDIAWNSMFDGGVHSGKRIQPQYLIDGKTCSTWVPRVPGYKVAVMSISSATNERTVIAAFTKDFPCNHALNAIRISGELDSYMAFTGIANSFVFDYLIRLRMGGLNLSFFILDESLIPRRQSLLGIKSLIVNLGKLSLSHVMFAPEWLWLRSKYPDLADTNWRNLWAVTAHERLRIRCMVDAIIAEVYGLSYEDLEYILRDDPSDPKGFWRIDKDKDARLRRTTLTLMAFKQLKEVGLEQFCREEWQLPRDVQDVVGPRFLPWQLEENPAESWRECEEHARKVLANKIFISSESATGSNTETKSSAPVPVVREQKRTTLKEWVDE